MLWTIIQCSALSHTVKCSDPYSAATFLPVCSWTRDSLQSPGSICPHYTVLAASSLTTLSVRTLLGQHCSGGTTLFWWNRLVLVGPAGTGGTVYKYIKVHQQYIEIKQKCMSVHKCRLVNNNITFNCLHKIIWQEIKVHKILNSI